MSEYWKSNPRKFCDFCKCWISDNKPSIEFHERGKRHKENVAKRVEEIAKKGKEDYENKLKEDDYMKEMEALAMKAYQKDIEQNPDMMGTKISQIAEASNAKIVVGMNEVSKKKQNVPASTNGKSKKWHEAKTSEGVSYYWNTETGESVWEAPEEGFLSLNKASAKESSHKTKKTKKKKKQDDLVYGPVPKAEAYSQWESVASSQNEVDLQLPEVAQELTYIPEVVYKKPEVTFKEKTVTLSAETIKSSQGVFFKKRKLGEEHKKNVRKRIDDS